ncbi:MAG: hypothetical protein E7464_00115 [Ruminococcaceae bacterium]|nr:hypothetical protein [Oscillospiraceae bacterium]
MKTWKRLLCLCLTLALLTSALPVQAAEEQKEGIFYYTVAYGAATITGADPTDEPLIIPETIGGCPVKRIGRYAFGREHKEPYAVIPASVAYIETNAFSLSNIRTFYIYGKNTECKASDLGNGRIYCYEEFAEQFPYYDWLIYLEDYPCDPLSLTPITEGDFEYALYEGEAILLKCTAEGEFVVPDTLGGCPVTYIGPQCFRSENIVCTLPDTVHTIGTEAFYGPYGFKETMNATLTKLPRDLKRVSFKGLSWVTLQDGTFPEGLERFCDYACEELRGERVTIPGTVKTINPYVFYFSKVKEVILEEGIETIEEHAFAAMTELTSITFPASLTQSGNIMENCDSVKVYGYIDTPVFDYCGEMGIPFTDRVTGDVYEAPYTTEQNHVKYTVYPNRFARVIGLLPNHPDHLVIPDTVDGVPVTKLREWAFISETLKSIYLPDTILELPEFAFDGCDVLEYVRLPEQLTSIGPNCFVYEHRVDAIYIPPTVTSIADSFCLDPHHLIIGGKAGSYAHSYANSHGHPFVAMEDDKAYIFSSGIYRVDPEGAVLLGGSMDYDRELRCGYCIIPDEVEGIPVVGIADDAQFGRPHYGIQEHTEELYLGRNVRFIGERALLNTEIEAIYTTPALESLPDPLFAGEGVIYGLSGTYAESYAKEHGIFFYPLDGTPFIDVPEDSWYFPSVYFCYWNGIMNGTSDTTFNPTGISSRAMLVTTLYRLCGEPNPDGDSDYFADVPEYTWYTSAVDWAAENGVVYGTSATTFSPNAPVTREQVATILYRLGDLLGEDVATYSPISGFKDADQASAYAKSALMWAVDVGILQGNDKNMLNPLGATTRAEMATILLRYIAWLES